MDFAIAQIYLGEDMPVNKEDALKYFNKGKIRIIEVNNNKNWFIPSFIEFQYGTLNPDNRVHHSIIQILEKYKINYKTLKSSLKDAKDKEKEQNKVTNKEKFEIFREKYPGTKRGLDTEFENFAKKNKMETISLLLPAITAQIKIHNGHIKADRFCPEYKNLSTWINQRCWEDEEGIIDKKISSGRITPKGKDPSLPGWKICVDYIKGTSNKSLIQAVENLGYTKKQLQNPTSDIESKLEDEYQKLLGEKC